jgi:hypothetical protein
MSLSIILKDVVFTKFVAELPGDPVQLTPVGDAQKTGDNENGFSYVFIRSGDSYCNNSEIALAAGTDGNLTYEFEGDLSGLVVTALSTLNSNTAFGDNDSVGMFVDYDGVIRATQGGAAPVATNIETLSWVQGMIFKINREGNEMYASVSENGGADYTILHKYVDRTSAEDLYPMIDNVNTMDTNTTCSIVDLRLKNSIPSPL